MAQAGIENGPHWWEERAFTTVPSLLPIRHYDNIDYIRENQIPVLVKTEMGVMQL